MRQRVGNGIRVLGLRPSFVKAGPWSVVARPIDLLR
jgi:hypothetical protein